MSHFFPPLLNNDTGFFTFGKNEALFKMNVVMDIAVAHLVTWSGIFAFCLDIFAAADCQKHRQNHSFAKKGRKLVFGQKSTISKTQVCGCSHAIGGSEESGLASCLDVSQVCLRLQPAVQRHRSTLQCIAAVESRRPRVSHI